ncbi:hypothetical protein HK102_009291, partial [Quaeritorhiza haematococci]
MQSSMQVQPSSGEFHQHHHRGPAEQQPPPQPQQQDESVAGGAPPDRDRGKERERDKEKMKERKDRRRKKKEAGAEAGGDREGADPDPGGNAELKKKKKKKKPTEQEDATGLSVGVNPKNNEGDHSSPSSSPSRSSRDRAATPLSPEEEERRKALLEAQLKLQEEQTRKLREQIRKEEEEMWRVQAELREALIEEETNEGETGNGAGAAGSPKGDNAVTGIKKKESSKARSSRKAEGESSAARRSRREKKKASESEPKSPTASDGTTTSSAATSVPSIDIPRKKTSSGSGGFGVGMDFGSPVSYAMSDNPPLASSPGAFTVRSYESGDDDRIDVVPISAPSPTTPNDQLKSPSDDALGDLDVTSGLGVGGEIVESKVAVEDQAAEEEDDSEPGEGEDGTAVGRSISFEAFGGSSSSLDADVEDSGEATSAYGAAVVTNKDAETHAVTIAGITIETDDPSHLFWVPAHLHPEVHPTDFRKWLAKYSTEGKAILGPGATDDETTDSKFFTSTPNAGVRRTKSFIERHTVITPDNIDEFLEKDKESVVVRSQSSASASSAAS